MIRIKRIFIILILLVIPITVNAGIICSDGWESSCTVPGPGCCSHHGGVGGFSGSDNYSSSDSSNSDFQIYFFWIPIGLILLFFIIKSNIDSNSDIDKDEFREFKELVDERLEKYRNTRHTEIKIVLDDKIVINALCYKYKDTINFVNISKNKEAYRLYKAGFFNKDGIFKTSNKLLIYDKFKLIYYQYEEIHKNKKYYEKFPLSAIFDKEENNYKSNILLDYKIVKIVANDIETNKKWTFDLELDSLYSIMHYIPNSEVTIKEKIYNDWCNYTK